METSRHGVPEMIDLEELGPWIDGLDSEAKGRIRDATGWGYTANEAPLGQSYDMTKGRKCIVDHAEDRTPAQGASWVHTYQGGPAEWFDILCEKHGLEQVISACKARAK